MRDESHDAPGVTPDSGQSRPRLGDVTNYVKEQVRRASVDDPPPALLRSSRGDGWLGRLGWRVRFEAARSRAVLLKWREQMYATRLGRVGVKLAVAFVGTLVVAIGVLLLPLPGPGWVIILAGLAILALEFHWARRLLMFTREQLRRWTRLVRDGSWVVKVASVGGLLLVIGAALWLSYQIVA